MAYLGDKRSRGDRRRTSLGPPSGVGKRRRRKDRRHIVVHEIDLSEKDWETLFHMSRMQIAAL